MSKLGSQQGGGGGEGKGRRGERGGSALASLTARSRYSLNGANLVAHM